MRLVVLVLLENLQEAATSFQRKFKEVLLGVGGITDRYGTDCLQAHPIGKLDESMCRMFEQESVSLPSCCPSDTSSTETGCSGGQGKPCGDPVKEGDARVLCGRFYD